MPPVGDYTRTHACRSSNACYPDAFGVFTRHVRVCQDSRGATVHFAQSPLMERAITGGPGWQRSPSRGLDTVLRAWPSEPAVRVIEGWEQHHDQNETVYFTSSQLHVSLSTHRRIFPVLLRPVSQFANLRRNQADNGAKRLCGFIDYGVIRVWVYVWLNLLLRCAHGGGQCPWTYTVEQQADGRPSTGCGAATGNVCLRQSHEFLAAYQQCRVVRIHASQAQPRVSAQTRGDCESRVRAWHAVSGSSRAQLQSVSGQRSARTRSSKTSSSKRGRCRLSALQTRPSFVSGTMALVFSLIVRWL